MIKLTRASEMYDFQSKLKNLNDAEILPENIPDIEKIVDDQGRDALAIAASLGLTKAVEKLLLPIVRYEEKRSYTSGTMAAHAEVGGSGVSKIRSRPSSRITKVQNRFVFDCLKQPSIRTSRAFDYALSHFSKTQDPSMLVNMYSSDLHFDSLKHKNLFYSRFKKYSDYDPNHARPLNPQPEKISENSDPLSFFMNIYNSNYAPLWNKNEKHQSIESIFKLQKIIGELAKDPIAVSKLSIESLNDFMRIQAKEGGLDEANTFENNKKIFTDILVGLSTEDKNEALKSALESYYPTFPKIDSFYHIELLNAGASINPSEIKSFENQIKNWYEKSDSSVAKTEKLFEKYAEIYKVDPNKPETVLNKSKQVIELHFKKDYKEVLQDYISKGLVDYKTLESVADCKYLDGEPNKKIPQETRIATLANLGADLSLQSEKGESIFSKLNKNQILDIVKNEKIKLTDQAILEISKNIFLGQNREDDRLPKLYNRIVSHQASGDVANYVEKLEQSNIATEDFLNLHLSHLYPFRGPSESDLDKSLYEQLKKYKEAKNDNNSLLEHDKENIPIDSEKITTTKPNDEAEIEIIEDEELKKWINEAKQLEKQLKENPYNQNVKKELSYSRDKIKSIEELKNQLYSVKDSFDKDLENENDFDNHRK